MRRGLLAAGLMMMWAGSAAGQTVVTINGAAMQATCHLHDSRLNPNPVSPVVMKWDAGKGYYEGDGNGMTYRVVKEDDGWKIRAILPAGDFALAWELRSPADSVPLRWGGYLSGGPLWKAYGIASEFDDKHIEVELLNP